MEYGVQLEVLVSRTVDFMLFILFITLEQVHVAQYNTNKVGGEELG